MFKAFDFGIMLSDPYMVWVLHRDKCCGLMDFHPKLSGPAFKTFKAQEYLNVFQLTEMLHTFEEWMRQEHNDLYKKFYLKLN